MASASQVAQDFLPNLFRTEQSYGWSVGMRSVSRTLLSDLFLPCGSVVDLGCGGGALVAELGGIVPGRPVFGLDLHPTAVELASGSAPDRVVQADVGALPFPDSSMALLLALDSFDQFGVDLDRTLLECRRVLCASGLLMIRVSAIAWLAGPHDIAFNTAQRYNRLPFVDAVARAGFKIDRCTYANLLLMPPVMVIRLLQQVGLLSMNESLYGNALANRLAAAALAAESLYLYSRDLPFGLSLYVLARKE